VRKSGNRLRITAQLAEAETGVHIWADRYDGALEEVFDLQDRITETVAAAIEPHLRSAEIERVKRKRPESLDAWDRYLRAQAQFDWYLADRDGLAAALQTLEETIRLYPDYAAPYALTAQCLVYKIGQGWSDDNESDRAEGARFARAAIQRDRDDPSVLWMVGHALGFFVQDWDTSVALVERSLALNPNSAWAYGFGGFAYLYTGEHRAAIAHFEKALRLSPVDRLAFRFWAGLGYAHCMLGEHELAIEWGSKAVREAPNFTSGYWPLASSLALLGRVDEARAVVARLLEVGGPQERFGIKVLRKARPTAGRDLMIEGARKAGLPE
jgi:adenylate cyclase